MDNRRQDFLCVLCADNGRRDENKHGRPAPGAGESARGRGAAPLRHAHPERPRGAETERTQPRVPRDTGREGGRDGAARPGWPPAPQARSKTAAARHPPASLDGHVLAAATSRPPLEGVAGGWRRSPSMAGLAAIFPRGDRVDVRHQWSVFGAIRDLLKFGLPHSQSVG